MKNLIIYFSWSNNTKRLVEEINKEFNFDIVRLERKTPYSKNYHTCAYVEAKEEYEKKIHPEINKLDIDINTYDKVLLFFPIWWYTFPMPVGTLIDKLKEYKGEIVVFANSYTNDQQYMENSMEDLKKIAPNVKFKEGLFNQKTQNHIDFIKNL